MTLTGGRRSDHDTRVRVATEIRVWKLPTRRRQSWLRDENRQTRRHRQHLRERITFRSRTLSPASFARDRRRLTSERLRGLRKIERSKREVAPRSWTVFRV